MDTITVDPEAPVPPYEQLRAHFARRIHDRTLPVGSRLPTVRRLAADLGIAANTVARAYRELEDAGLVEGRGRAGTFVSAGGQHARQRAGAAAMEYAVAATGLGLEPEEAVDLVRAALLALRSRTVPG